VRVASSEVNQNTNINIPISVQSTEARRANPNAQNTNVNIPISKQDSDIRRDGLADQNAKASASARDTKPRRANPTVHNTNNNHVTVVTQPGSAQPPTVINQNVNNNQVTVMNEQPARTASLEEELYEPAIDIVPPRPSSTPHSRFVHDLSEELTYFDRDWSTRTGISKIDVGAATDLAARLRQLRRTHESALSPRNIEVLSRAVGVCETVRLDLAPEAQDEVKRNVADMRSALRTLTVPEAGTSQPE
jgi:hypothetical protein